MPSKLGMTWYSQCVGVTVLRCLPNVRCLKVSHSAGLQALSLHPHLPDRVQGSLRVWKWVGCSGFWHLPQMDPVPWSSGLQQWHPGAGAGRFGSCWIFLWKFASPVAQCQPVGHVWRQPSGLVTAWWAPGAFGWAELQQCPGEEGGHPSHPTCQAWPCVQPWAQHCQPAQANPLAFWKALATPGTVSEVWLEFTAGVSSRNQTITL